MLIVFVSAPAAAQVPCPPQMLGSQGGSPVEECGATQTRRSSTPDYKDSLATCSGLQPRRNVSVANAADLQNAVANARCGDTIKLAAGKYDSKLSIKKSCPPDNPVIVKGAADFASIATGQWSVTGDYNIVTGIDFNGAGAGIGLRGANNKVFGNKFRNWTGWAAISTGSTTGQTHNEIAYNEIGPGGPVAAGKFRWGIRAYTTDQEENVPRNVWVHHNRFRDFVSPDGRSDAMEVGESGTYPWAQSVVAGWYIEDNLFTNMQDKGEAILDMKLGGSVIRRNTVSDSTNVSIQARQGTFNIWESNYLENGDIKIHGRGHTVACNVGPIKVISGEDEWNVLANFHPRSYETFVAKNVGSLSVGYVPNSNYTWPAFATTIEEHRGSIGFDLHTDTVDNRDKPSSHVCPAAVKLSASQVGPSAMGQALASYLACRRP
jgi:hypothetical protein